MLLLDRMLYAAAAVNFEPVLWPAARFDLLATAFTLAALISAVRYFRDTRAWSWAFPFSFFCYAMGILNKESSYCFPLLLLCIIGTHRLWDIPRPETKKVLLYFSLGAAVTIASIFARIAVYGSLGGYPTPESLGGSPHFKLGIKAFTSLLRALPIPLLGVNTTSAASGWLFPVLVLFAIFILATACACRGCFGRREYGVAACTLLASVPILNIVGWIGSPMQHSRYLYLPTVFVMLLIASTLGKMRWSTVALGLFLGINALGAISNICVYRDMLARTEILSEEVRGDWARQTASNTIYLLDLPEHPCGVFYFASELIEKISRKIPRAVILTRKPAGSTDSNNPAGLIYQWSNTDLALHRIAGKSEKSGT